MFLRFKLKTSAGCHSHPSFVYFRVGSKPNGTMNGDLHNHIDHELEILHSGNCPFLYPLLSSLPMSVSSTQVPAYVCILYCGQSLCLYPLLWSLPLFVSSTLVTAFVCILYTGHCQCLYPLLLSLPMSVSSTLVSAYPLSYPPLKFLSVSPTQVTVSVNIPHSGSCL